MTVTGPWVVYACRTDYAADVAGIIARTGGTVAIYVDNTSYNTSDNTTELPPHDDGLEPLVTPAGLTGALRALPVVIPLITPGHRVTVLAEIRALGCTNFPPLVDPTSTVTDPARVGDGAVINAGTVLAALVQVGQFVHVNRSASVGHHCTLEAFSTLGPGVVLAGRVVVERGAFLGAGAICAPRVRIGANAVVGAGAVVVNDVPAGAVVVGNPARVIRQSDTGYGGVSVP